MYSYINCLLSRLCRLCLIEDTDLLQELNCKPHQGGIHEDLLPQGPDHPSVGHHECINDIAVAKLSHNDVISWEI